MITDVYIIRKGLGEFFVLDPESDNWSWTPDIEEATIFLTPNKAEETIVKRKTGNDTYVYQIPYSVPTPQQRKRKIKGKPVKRKIKGKPVKKGKPSKRK